MKKFLTVLLALSVVFTYSVSAVFADTTSAVEAANDAVTAQEAALSTALADYAKAITYDGSGLVKTVPNNSEGAVAPDARLTKTAIEAGIAQIKTDYNLAIETAAASAIADGDFSTADATAVENAWKTALGTNAKISDVLFGTKYAGADSAMYTQAVSDAKAALQADMDSYDPSLYSTADAKTITDAKITATNAIGSATNSADGLLALTTAKTNFDNAVKDLEKSADTATALAKYKTQAKAAVESAASTFAATYKAALQSTIDTSADPIAVAQANTKLSTADADIAAVAALYTSQIDAETTDDQTLAQAKGKIDGYVAAAKSALTSANFAAAQDKVTTKDLLLKYASEYAANLKNAYDKTTGLAMYNESTVDAALTEITALINKLDTSVDTYAEIQTWFGTNCATAADEKTALTSTYKPYAIELITKNSADITGAVTEKAFTDLKGNYNKTSWDAEYQDAIAAIQKEYTTKINAAKTKDALVALVKEAQEKIDAVALNTADSNSVKAQIALNMGTLGYTSVAGAAAGTGGTIDAYANSKNIGGAYSTALADAKEAAAKVLYDAVLAQKNTKLTNAEIQAILQNNYAAALAKIDEMKTNTELKTAADAVIAAIKALPTTATLETKDQYIAVAQQYDDYLALAGAKKADITNQGLLQAYMTKIVSLEKAAVDAQINALPTTVTVENQAVIEAARAAVDAYDKAYSKYGSTTANNTNGTNYGYTAITETKLTTAESKLSDALLTDAAKKIAALSDTITEADADAVKAAREAYDKLSDAEKAEFSDTLYNKLVAAEKALENLDINAVEALKITASSTAKKGSITVKWTVKGDASVADGYQIYRSTKKSSGYKKFFTTTKKTYKNTKSLKKGTRYYYKVRAYKVVDGKTYYSDWSNKAYRIAK